MRHLSVLMVLLFANGCWFLPSWGGSSGDDGWDYSEEVHVVDGRIENAWLGGEMNDIGEFTGDAYEATYYGGYGSSTITLHAGENGGDDFGWAMIGLTTYDEGGFEGETFAPGASLTTESGQLDAQGCTGPSHGNWDFDGHAQNVEVQVEAGPTPNSRLIHFQAHYDGQGVTEGSFILVVEEPGAGVVDG